jgi:hypothetical protein
MGATRVRAALDSANLNNLSTQEKNVLMSMTSTLAADGYVSSADADIITGMIKTFESTGSLVDTLTGGNFGSLQTPRNAGGGYQPSPTALAAQQSPTNALFGGLLGFFVDKVVQTFKDALFVGTSQGVLGTCDGSDGQQRVSDAIGSADLSKLSGSERSTVLQMIGFAAIDGHISNTEANAITDYLNRAQDIRPPANSQWTVKQDGGNAHIDLGNYTLDLNEGNSQFVLTNKKTGETMDVWGDPHVKVDGKQVGDFYGTMTLNLDDGTKITINTTPYNAGNGMTLSSRLTITQGDRAMVVKGLDQNTLGDLEIAQIPVMGQLIDSINSDGVNIYENPEGAGWLRQDDSGELVAIDGAFLSSIRNDNGAGHSPANANGPRATGDANPFTVRNTVDFYRNNPDYEQRPDGSYALKYKPLQHGDTFVLGLRVLHDGTKVWD